MREKRPGRARVRFDAPQKMDGIDLLRALDDGSAAACIFDPQHRDVLDAMGYGNEGARQKGRASLPAMTGETIASFAEEIERVLRPSGHCFLWVDKFSLASGSYRGWMRWTTEFSVVDMIAWGKRRIGMGRRARCASEHVLVLQKGPTRAKGIWTDNSIPDFWPERIVRDHHPHAKPRMLTARLIQAVTRPGDLVVDPCAGGYSTLDICRATERRFVGCDLLGGAP